MTRHAITPTDAGKPLPANPAWRYSDPVDAGRVTWVDAMQLAWIAEHDRAADARNAKLGGGRS